MEIFVKTITGNTITLVNLEETVDSVKERIAEIEGVPVAQQRLIYSTKYFIHTVLKFIEKNNVWTVSQLIYSGREMEDGRPLSFYNMQEDCTIHMMLALYGGRGVSRCNKLWKLACYHRLQKKICRKCYGRLPSNATICRKVECGITSDIRNKKCHWARDHNCLPKLTDWTRP